MSDSLTIRRARPEDIAAAAETLAAAFQDYPWTRYVIPAQYYETRLLTLQRKYLEHALKHGIVAVEQELRGVIALLPPEAPAPDEATMAEIIELHGERLGRLQTLDPAQPQGLSWTLETVGVHPSGQGRGLGGALLGFGLAEARSRGASAVSLETSDPRNVALYRRHDFEVTEEHELPGGLRLWRMISPGA